MPTQDAVSTEKLVQDLKLVIVDLEELLRATASQAGDKVAAAREEFEERMYRARKKLAELEDIARDRGRQAAEATDAFVRDNPWQAAGIAAGIGLILGMLISRR